MRYVVVDTQLLYTTTDPSVYRLHPISNVGQRSGNNNGHRVIDVRPTHFIFYVDGYDILVFSLSHKIIFLNNKPARYKKEYAYETENSPDGLYLYHCPTFRFCSFQMELPRYSTPSCTCFITTPHPGTLHLLAPGMLIESPILTEYNVCFTPWFSRVSTLFTGTVRS